MIILVSRLSRFFRGLLAGKLYETFLIKLLTFFYVIFNLLFFIQYVLFISSPELSSSCLLLVAWLSSVVVCPSTFHLYHKWSTKNHTLSTTYDTNLFYVRMDCC